MLTEALIRTFVKNREDVDNDRVRYAYGRLAGASGLTANVLLFAAKLAAGLLSGSLAIVADAFNNLSDAGSSIVTLVGFKLSSAPSATDGWSTSPPSPSRRSLWWRASSWPNRR